MDAEAQSGECLEVGQPMSDIAGIGLLVGFAGQALLSLALALWVFFFSRHGRLDVRHDEGSAEHAIEVKRLESVLELLMIGNDIQMLTGIALMITTFSGSKTIDLYHLHVIYDTVSFVGVSNAAALVCWTFCASKLQNREAKPSRRPHRPRFRLKGRFRVTFVFAALFLALTILLCVRLNGWSTTTPGRCFRTDGTSTPGAHHPGTDKAYVALTSTWLLVVMLAAAIGGTRERRLILALAFLQFPVHLYMMVALRTANQAYLVPEGGGGGGGGEGAAASGEGLPENEWDFGQTTAVLLLLVSINEFFSKGWGLYKFEKNARAAAAAAQGRRSDEEKESEKKGASAGALEAGPELEEGPTPARE